MKKRMALRFGLPGLEWITFLLMAAVTAPAQTPVTIDWSSPSPTPVGAPAQIDNKVTLSVVVTSVNDILYQYIVNTSVTTAPTDDLANLLALVAPAKGALPGGGADPCESFKTKFGDLEAAIKSDKSLNPSATGGVFASIALKDSLAAWMKIDPLKTLTDLKNDSPAACFDSQAQSALAEISAIDRRAKGSHRTDAVDCVLQPGQQCTVTVNEYYTAFALPGPGGQPPPQPSTVTTASGKAFIITPASHILVLSGGFLATTLGARTYTASNVPGQTSPVLVVSNNSRIRPAAVALLNYQIPRLDSYPVGLALSAGPVITFGGNGANVSTLGFFAGISGHFWHRLYVTPGFHFGQFADFPPGFVPGAVVPTSIATPTAENRWTSRFGIAITFQTPDFTKLTGGSSTTTTTTSTPANQPKKSTP